MNYLRFHLTHCSEDILEWLLKEHKRLVKKTTIKGLSPTDVKEIIKDYFIENKGPEDVEQKCLQLELKLKKSKSKKVAKSLIEIKKKTS